MKLEIWLWTGFRVVFAQIGKKEENLERIGEGTEFTQFQKITFFLLKKFKGSTDVFQVKKRACKNIYFQWMYLF